jgi:hypothetical protein
MKSVSKSTITPLVYADLHLSTTGEPKFPECQTLPRVPKIEHSGKSIFPECCTRGRNTLGEESISRVSKNPWHSEEGWHSGKSSSLSATLGEEGHSQKEISIWRQHWTEPFAKKLKKVLPECHALALGEGASSPRAFSWHSGNALFPESHAKALGEIFLFF